MGSISKKKQRQNLRLIENTKAIQEGPQQKKSFHYKDIRSIKPETLTQEEVFDSWFEDDKNVVMLGSAGTGKSFLALFFGLLSILDPDSYYRRIVIIRSAVQSRELGHLPGDLNEKIEVYEEPYKAICDELASYSNYYDNLKKKGLIEYHTTSFLRGNTFDDSIIIFDEIQNANFQEISTVLTRVGKNSKVILCGDFLQNDLIYKKSDKSGLEKAVRVLDRMNSVAIHDFCEDDILRSGFVKEFLIAQNEVDDDSNF